METTWIVVANAQHARFFQRTGRGEDWEHLWDREPQVRAAAARVDPPVTDVEAQRFAHQLADMLERSLGGYERLVIAAPPRFLSVLRAALPPRVAERLEVTLDTDRSLVRSRDLDESFDLR